tara:strand:+ start:1372 stop:1572 length:201 start_codon:yes stop_codon:yes gene_type:complete
MIFDELALGFSVVQEPSGNTKKQCESDQEKHPDSGQSVQPQRWARGFWKMGLADEVPIGGGHGRCN